MIIPSTEYYSEAYGMKLGAINPVETWTLPLMVEDRVQAPTASRHGCGGLTRENVPGRYRRRAPLRQQLHNSNCNLNVLGASYTTFITALVHRKSMATY